MSEAAGVVHELAVEGRKLIGERERQKQQMKEISGDHREQLRADLVSWADLFAREYGYTPSDSRRKIIEVLSSSI